MKKSLVLFFAVVVAACGDDAPASPGGSGGSAGAGGAGGSAGAGGAGGVGGAGGTAGMPANIFFTDQLLNIAHRGGRRENPEHTILAYEQALLNGADVLELDVHATSDGVLVVMHDDTVDRTTDGEGVIKDMTFEAISMLDAAYDFSTDGEMTFPFRGMGHTVPTMQEVFEAFPDAPYVIEIKQEEPSIVDAFVEQCRTSGIIDNMVGAAFSDDVLVELRAAAPEMETSLGVIEVFAFVNLSMEAEAQYEPPGRFLQVPIEFSGIPVLTPEFVARAQRLDMKIHAWTINDEMEMRDLIDLGVNGLITDFPTRLRDILLEE